MTTYNYTVIIQDTEPSSPQMFWEWVKKDTCQIFVRLKNDWLLIAEGENSITATDGTYWRQCLDQTAEPTSPEVGDRWVDDNGTMHVYLDDWVTIVGG